MAVFVPELMCENLCVYIQGILRDLFNRYNAQ